MAPLGSAPIFISLTAGRSPGARRRAALEAAAAAGGVGVVFALFGRLILDYLHVSVESLTIAGGLLLLLGALQMLRGEEIAPADTGHGALGPPAVGEARRNVRPPRLPPPPRRKPSADDALVHQGGAAGKLATPVEQGEARGGPAAAR